MKDKQILIDGVPVQDCCYFDYENDGYEDSCYMYDNECSANCNCYYKQLKAKEQELEQYKRSKQASYELLQQECNKVVLENRRLKAENERLKRRGTPPLIDIVLTENKKLKQTLDEIKAIVQFGYRPYKLCGEYNDCCDVLNKIWNKISEIDDESYLDNHWLFTKEKGED